MSRAGPQPPTLRPQSLTLFSHGLATLKLTSSLPSPPSQTRVSFTPPTHQLNDILKTLVVSTDGAITVTSITYPPQHSTSASKHAHNLSVDFHDALLDLLHAAVGTHVSLAHPFQPADPDTSCFSSVRPSDNGVCAGTLVGLQTFQVPLPYQSAHPSRGKEQYVLVLTKSNELRKVLLRAVTDVSFEDPAMKRRLADSLNREKSRVANAETPITITISPKPDQEHRPVSDTTPSEITVRYAVESPVYKLTHRIILPSTPDSDHPEAVAAAPGTLLLQTWAIIDSPFPHDLQDISVSLVAGKPMSFRHDLASKRYIERPEEVVDTGPGYGKPSLGATQLKTFPMARRKGRQSNTAGFSLRGSAPRAKGGDDEDDDEIDKEMTHERGVASTSGLFGAPRPPTTQEQLSASVEGMDVAEVGDVYEYRIPNRVTLSANESALLPVISKQVEGSRVFVYAQDVHRRYALSAVRLVNSAQATVEKGPVSVYEEDLLAGEGMLDSLLPGKQALIPYAIDGSVSIHSEPVHEAGSVVRVWYANGLLSAERWQEMKTTYKIENSGISEKVLYLFHRRSKGYSEGDVGVTREDGVLGEVDAQADGGKVKYKLTLGQGCTTLRVVDRTKSTQRYNLESNCTTDGIAMLLCGGVVSSEIAEKMKTIKNIKADIASQEFEITRMEKEALTVEGDQQWYGKNLASLGGVMQANRFKDDSVMNRYVTELEQSEDRIRHLRETIENERSGVSSLKRTVYEQMLEIVAMLEK